MIISPISTTSNADTDRSVGEFRNKLNNVLESIDEDMKGIKNKLDDSKFIYLDYTVSTTASFSGFIEDNIFGTRRVYSESGIIFFSIDANVYNSTASDHAVRFRLNGNTMDAKTFTGGVSGVSAYDTWSAKGTKKTGKPGWSTVTITHQANGGAATDLYIKNREIFILGL